MEKTVFECATCGRETDYAVAPSTQCHSCRKDFCSQYHKPDCFNAHIKKDNCKGGHETILNPAWEIKLRPSKEKGNASFEG